MESRQVSGVRVVDVQQFIDARPLSTQHWVIFALCFLMMVVDGLEGAARGFAVAAIMAEWSLPKEAFGLALE